MATNKYALHCVQSAVDVWQLFQANFLKLWDEHSHHGDAYPEQLFGQSAQQGQEAQKVHTLSAKAQEQRDEKG